MTWLRQVSPSIVEAIELPKVISLGQGLTAAFFSLMKLIPAHFILDRAHSEGQLEAGGMVVESTSGTFGLALALLCNLRGYRLHLVSDPAVDVGLHRRLLDLGACVDILQKPAAVGGFQRVRLDRLQQLRDENPGHFWPAQYENPNNPASYARCAEILAESIGRIDCVVGTVGSGGSMCGIGRYLRLLFPALHLVGVDTHGSVLFGLADEGKRLLRGMGNSLLPGNLDHTAFNEVHWVTGKEGLHATRLLHQNHAIFAGPTSGAAYMVARWWAERNPGATVVVLFPDEGYRYQDTVYSDEWLRENDLVLTELPAEPVLCASPQEVPQRWSRCLWERRSYEEVMGPPRISVEK